MSLRLMKSSVIAMIMMALTGCFSVELDAPASVEQNSIFTMTATPLEAEGIVSYQWTLNDAVISEDDIHHTMLPTLGDYTLTVIATDEAGNEDTQSQKISVIAQASLNVNFSFGINVSDKSGFALSEVPVTINGTTVNTDQYGLAQFDGISQTSLMLVSAAAEGYLTQTYQYRFDAAQESAVANLTLQNVNPESHVVDSTEAIDITETELHSKLILAANSFVDGNGNAVTGEVEITITPIDIRAVDNAFLGGGQALTDSGEAVALISTGMVDYQFSQNGSAVSLAEGVTAIIEMDLAVTTGDDGRVFAEGDTIEMWWFDPATGFWIEDGMGTVQLSSTSETGLKLVATVEHFTTWNWDYYKQDDRSSITFNCLKNGQSLASNESCQITASSTSISRQFIASSEGVTAINTPPNVTFSVVAAITTGNALWSGSVTMTTVPGDNVVSVNMESRIAEMGYIQCRIINSAVTSIVPCNTVISAGSIAPHDVDTTGSNNYRAGFPYVRGDVLNIAVTLESGLSQTIMIDTAGTNGTLDIEVIFDIKFGSLQCSATLDSTDIEFFPCNALITDGEDSVFPIYTGDFSGNPPKASFTYSRDAQELAIEVASIFDAARLREYNGRYYISGRGTLDSIDLTSEPAISNIQYDVNSESVYAFKCIDDTGDNVECNITWYNSMETIIFSGAIGDLSGPDIIPTWMNGKVFIESPLSGFGSARDMDQNIYSEETEIDVINRIITFTFGNEPR